MVGPIQPNNILHRLAVLLADTRSGSETLVLSSTMRTGASTSRSTSRIVGVSEAATTSLETLGIPLLGDGAGRGKGGESHDGDEEFLCHVLIQG
jgi:hypothetical protein